MFARQQQKEINHAKASRIMPNIRKQNKIPLENE